MFFRIRRVSGIFDDAIIDENVSNVKVNMTIAARPFDYVRLISELYDEFDSVNFGDSSKILRKKIVVYNIKQGCKNR